MTDRLWDREAALICLRHSEGLGFPHSIDEIADAIEAALPVAGASIDEQLVRDVLAEIPGWELDSHQCSTVAARIVAAHGTATATGPRLSREDMDAALAWMREWDDLDEQGPPPWWAKLRAYLEATTDDR